MKFCLHSRLEAEYLKKADEIKVDTRDYKSVPDLFEKYPDTDIILELFHKEDKNWEELRRWNILSRGHLILCLDNPEDFPKARETGAKYYLGYPVASMYEANALKANGVCYIVIGMPLFFNMNDVASLEVDCRCVPNVAYYDGIIREDGVCGQWIRPEDLEMYSPMIDVVEFNFVKPDKEQALFRIYAEQKEWPGELGMIIENLNHLGVNRMISRDVTIARMNCHQKCQGANGTCRICSRALLLADPERIKEYKLSEKTTL